MGNTSPNNEPDCERWDWERKSSISFLDTSLSIEKGKVEIDLFRKITDRNQYLLPSSCHPRTTTQSISYSLGLRNRTKGPEIERIERTFVGLKIPKKVALLKVKAEDQENIPIFALKFDPRMPSVQPMLSKHYRSMISQDTYLKEVFAQPPLTTFRRKLNIQNFIIKVKVPPPPECYPKRLLKGMKKCGKAGSACPFIEEEKEVKINEIQNGNLIKKNYFWIIQFCLSPNLSKMWRKVHWIHSPSAEASSWRAQGLHHTPGYQQGHWGSL